MACKHITNFTSAHESHARKLPIGNLDYPDNHIEVDHHLTIALPMLLDRYPAGPDTLYVHLLRERDACVSSFARRKAMDLFADLHCFVHCTSKTPDRRRQAAEYYYDAMNSMIDAILRKPWQERGWSLGENLSAFVEALPSAWPIFWKLIGAEGDFEAALTECSKHYNRGIESKGEVVRDEH